MNICKIELRGQVGNIIRFLSDNVNFAKADSKGIRFTNKLLFGKLMKELDNDAMKEIYGVPVANVCNWMSIAVYKNERDYYDEDIDCYVGDPDNDDRPHDLYKFKISTYDGKYFNITKDFFRGEYFRENTYVEDKSDFINQFFKDFTELRPYNKKEMIRLQDWGTLTFEVGVYDIPLEILETWRREYELSVDTLYFDGNKITRCIKHLCDEEEFNKREYTEEEQFADYLGILLDNRWVDLYSIERNLCMMLYDMKDKVPFKIDLEVEDEESRMIRRMGDNGPVFKYNLYLTNIKTSVYGLANKNSNMQLVKLYAWVKNAHNDIFNGEKSYTLTPFIPRRSSTCCF